MSLRSPLARLWQFMRPPTSQPPTPPLASRLEPQLALPPPEPERDSTADAMPVATASADDSASVVAPPAFLRDGGMSPAVAPTYISRATLAAGPTVLDAGIPLDQHVTDLTAALCDAVDMLTVMRLTEVSATYHRLCEDNGWVPRPWHQVSAQLSDALYAVRTDGGPRKPYRNLPDLAGDIRKTRVFIVPVLSSRAEGAPDGALSRSPLARAAAPQSGGAQVVPMKRAA